MYSLAKTRLRKSASGVKFGKGGKDAKNNASTEQDITEKTITPMVCLMSTLFDYFDSNDV